MIPTTFSRRDNSLLGRWWWTVDRLALSLLLILIVIGVFLSFAASPSVAERLNLGTFLVESNSPNFKPTANDVIVIFL